MVARWASFATGLWLVFAPLVLGYPQAAAVLHDVAIGLLVCVAALAALEWPLARFVQLLPGLWLLGAPRALGFESEVVVANQLASGVLLVALTAVPSGRFLRSVAGAGRAA